jgi:hypothetical protein
MKAKTFYVLVVIIVVVLGITIFTYFYFMSQSTLPTADQTGLPPIEVTSGTLFINGTFDFTLTNYVTTPNSIESVTASGYPSVGGTNATMTPTTMEYGTCVGNFTPINDSSVADESCMVTGIKLNFVGYGIQYTINFETGKPLSGQVFVSNSTMIQPFP